MPRIGLRAKLFLVTLSLAAIPLVGVGYVREMESLLVVQQEQNLLAAARAIATALNDRPALLRLKPQDPALKRDKEAAIAAMLGDGSAVSSGAQTVAQVIATEDTAEPRAVSDDIEAIVASLHRNRTRVWVIDKRFQLLALSGTLKSPETLGGSASSGAVPSKPLVDNASGALTWWEKLEAALLRPLYARLLTRPTENFDDSLPEDAIVSGSEVTRALAGDGATRWRPTPDNRARVLSAAHPVWAGDEVVAVVVVEETGNAIASFTSRALEKLLTATLAAFVLVAGVVLLFASHLAHRVRRLRDEAESAVDTHGRVRHLAAGSGAGDEIGDLSRSFSSLLERLAQYHDYLEHLCARITHEFRTPVTVVRSSLDNLAMQPLPPEARAYMERADEGLKRLNQLITRLGEARRIESAIADTPHEWYDPCAAVRGCVEGYRAAFPQHAFALQLPDQALQIRGAPDLLAQALDKLAANATGFATAGTPILFRITLQGCDASIEVDNTGPPLPDLPKGAAAEYLFNSMVSIRTEPTMTPAPGPGAAPDAHLGLGLFIVRLVAQFHGGAVTARNRDDQAGVVFSMRIPVKSA